MGKNEMSSVVSLVELEAQYEVERTKMFADALATAKCDYAERHGSLMPEDVEKMLTSILNDCHDNQGSVKIVEKSWGFGSDFFSDLGNGRQLEWRYCRNQNKNANPWILLYATRRDRISAALEAVKDPEVREHLERFLRNEEIKGYLRITRASGSWPDEKKAIRLNNGSRLVFSIRIDEYVGTSREIGYTTTCAYSVCSNMHQRLAAYVASRTGLYDKKGVLEILFCDIEIYENTEVSIATSLLEMLPSLREKQKQILGTSKGLIEGGRIPSQMFAVNQKGNLTIFLPYSKKKGNIGTFYPFF